MKRIALIVLIAVLSGAGAGLAYHPFSQDEQVVDASGSGYSQWTVDIVADGDRTHFVFLDDRGANGEVHFFTRESNGTVTNFIQLSSGTFQATFPRIAFDPDQGRLYVAYVSDLAGTPHVYIRTSPDSGSTWFSAQALDMTSMQIFGKLDIAVMQGGTWDGSVVVAWEDLFMSSDVLIRSNVSRNLGVSWVGETTAVDAVSYNDATPALDADDDGNLYLAFTRESGTYNDPRPCVAVSSDGVSFSFLQQLNILGLDMYHDHDPDITAWGRSTLPGEGGIAVAWHGASQSGDVDQVMAATSTNGGSSWTGADTGVVLCDENLISQRFPRLADDGAGTIYCSWEKEVDASHFHAFVSIVPASLLLPQGECIRLDTPPSNEDQAFIPVISRAASGRVATAWDDLRSGISHPHFSESVPTLSDSFDDLSQWSGYTAVAIDCTKSVDAGGCSAKMGDSSKAEGLLEHAWPKVQNGSIIFWFWDGYVGGLGDPYMTEEWWGGVRYDDGTKAGVVRSLGIVNPGSTYSTQGESGTEDTGVGREEGWHKVEVKSEKDEGKAPAFFIYLDDVLVYQDTSFPYFEELFFQGGSGDAPYHVDELNCYTEDNDDSPPEAPTLSGLGILVLAAGLGLALRRRSS